MRGQKRISYVENIVRFKQCLDERAINHVDCREKFVKELMALWSCSSRLVGRLAR